MEAPERVFIEFEEYDDELYINDINYDERSTETESEVEYIRTDIVQELIDMLKKVKPLISKTLGLQSLTWEELSVINKIQQKITEES